MRKDRIMIDTALAHSFMPLLESVDPELYLHLQRHGMALPTFCRQWIACWFSQDVPDVEVASRLLDAFLVGHPLLPLYASVALMTSLRTQILSSGSRLSTLYSLLRGLPVQNLFEEDCRMFKAENIVATALGYMKVTPPQVLIDLISSKANVSLAIEAIAMFREPPAWCFRSHAPSDYSLLTRAQELRSLASSGQKFKIADEEHHFPINSGGSISHPDMAGYPLSFTALGCFSQSKRAYKPTLKVASFSIMFLVAIAAAIYWTFSSLDFIRVDNYHPMIQEKSKPLRVSDRPIAKLYKSTSRLAPEQRGPILSLLVSSPSKPEVFGGESVSNVATTETIRDNRPLSKASSIRVALRVRLSTLAKVIENASAATVYAPVSADG
jgi:hypothetical protein